MNPLDHSLFPALNRGAANAAFDWFLPRITNLHQWRLFLVVVLAFCLFVLWKGPRRRQFAVLCALLAVGLSDVTAARVVKRLAPRDRPCRVAAGRTTPAFPGVRVPPGSNCPGSSSFPSNHAANMMALAAVGWWFTRGRARWLWFLLPLVIGYSRIYLGFHYPTDVLAGYLLGGLIAAVILFLFRRALRENPPAPSSTVESTEVRASSPAGDTWSGARRRR